MSLDSQSRRQRPAGATAWRVLGFTLAWVSGGSAIAAEQDFPAGSYALVAQMMMPHLDEMRRMKTHEQHCLTGDEPAALFPVLRQPALRGCRLGYAERRENTVDYVLACASARVASGRANLVLNDGRVTAMLDVKMGGKNMTFSQRVVATRSGPCSTSTELSLDLPRR